jgi:hypothetical protein
MISIQVARLVELRNSVLLAPYDFRALGGKFFADRVAGPTRQMGGLLRVVTRNAGIGRGNRYDLQGLAGTVRNIGAWCDLFRQFDCEPLEAEVAKLRRHDSVLERLQREFPGEPRRVVDEGRGT